MSERDEGFLARWSRRKLASHDRGAASAPDAQRAEPAVPPPAPGEEAATRSSASSPAETPRSELPALESLTAQSDFAPFMQAGVDADVKGRALKTLFSDPALYPMDGLDVYIDDYTKPDPLPPGWLEKLNQLASLHDEPQAEQAASTAPPAEATEAPPVAAGTPGEVESSNSTAPARDAPVRDDSGV